MEGQQTVSDPHPRLREIEAALRGGIAGEVAVDPVSLGVYATDASIYEEEPVAVVVPVSVEDVEHVHAVAREYGVPVLPRGGGTALGGQTTGRAIVIDLSKHLHRISDVDIDARTVRVEPGRVRDELNAHLAATGLHFAPETATSNRATIGGMIGNDSSGTRSIRYGKTIDHVVELRVLLSTGEVLDLRPMSRAEWDRIAERDDREGLLYRTVRDTIESNRAEIERRFPRVMRRVAGYHLDAFPAEGPWNMANLVVGSEGTLATVLEARLSLEPLPAATAVAAVHYADLREALSSVPRILDFEPSAVELLDRTLLHLARGNAEIQRKCDFVEGDPAVILLVEQMGPTADEARAALERTMAALKDEGIGYAHPMRTDADGIARVWEVRKAGVGILMSIKGERKPLPFIEDAAVPVESLADYIDGVGKICDELEVPLSMYAHASVGLLHVRPLLDLKQAADVENLKEISRRSFELVRAYGGSFSGEHGDGRVRSPMIEPYFGAVIVEAFRRIKTAFDPLGLLNPGKILDPEPMDAALRIGPHYAATEPETRFRYRDEGSFASAVERCTGVGACRKTLGGTMCPSYIATRDELHSTRGRANALRFAMTGRLGTDGMTGDALAAALDLCLSCKACVTECPSGVDMARLKAETLAARYDQHGAPPAARFVAASADTARRIAGPLAPLANWVSRLAPVRALLERRYGITRARPLPGFAREKLSRAADRRARAAAGGVAEDAAAVRGVGVDAAAADRAGEPGTVLLFADTYSECHEPDVGLAAMDLLERLGYRVHLGNLGCCQRPRISTGFLDEARAAGAETLAAIDLRLAQLPTSTAFLVLEPSCASALAHDLPDLVDDSDLADRIARRVRTIDQFLADEADAGRLDTTRFADAPRGLSFLVHGHCHQKALSGSGSLLRALRLLPGATVTEIDSGCCGMAGAFGYEVTHHELSLKIGEDRLFPAVRAMSSATRLVASGFSCRHQVADALSVRAVHVAVALNDALEAGKSRTAAGGGQSGGGRSGGGRSGGGRSGGGR